MLNTSELEIDLNFWNGKDSNRIKTLKLVLAGYNNNSIAKELNFSLKNIESIVAKFFRKCGILTKGEFSYLVNPRVRLLTHGINNQWLRYKIHPETAKSILSCKQFASLLLCGAGCSNKAISQFLNISVKTVESRLNSLFGILGTSIKTNNQINPRVRLVTSSIQQKLLFPYSIKVASAILKNECWAEVLANREQIHEDFLRLQFEQPYVLNSESSIASILDKLSSLKIAFSASKSTSPFYEQPFSEPDGSVTDKISTLVNNSYAPSISRSASQKQGIAPSPNSPNNPNRSNKWI